MKAQDGQEDTAAQALYVEINIKPPRLVNCRKIEMK